MNAPVSHMLESTPIRNLVHPPAATRVSTLAALERHCKNAGHLHLVQSLQALRQHPEVLVVDFNWTNYAALLSRRGLVRIPNLHPRRSTACHQAQVVTARQAISRFVVTLEPQHPLLALGMVWHQWLSGALSQQQLEEHRRAVVKAMWHRFTLVSKAHSTIITERLDVGRLYACPQKRAVIDDLGWHWLMADLDQLTTARGQHLLALSHFDHSLTCPECRTKHFGNRRGNHFLCQRCGLELDPDLVALLNLWAARGQPQQSPFRIGGVKR
jgi:hypothetical protein